MLAIKNLCKSYGDVNVLNNIELDIRASESISILGRSGSGKSTLLKIISGLEKPDSGSVTYLQQGYKPFIVFQDYRASLYPWLNSFENISLARNELVQESQEIDDLLKSVGLEKRSNNYPYEMSGGENQRVALSRAIYYNPDILLLDEPFASVDVVTKCDLQDCLKRLSKSNNIPTVLVTHDVEEALYMGEKIYILNANGNGLEYLGVSKFHDSKYSQDCKLDNEFLLLRKKIIRKLSE